MVKTRSDLKGVRVSAKAPRKMPASSCSNTASPGRSSKKYDGGNSYCPRETPYWQKEITNFFPTKSNNSAGESSSSCSSSAMDDASGSSSSVDKEC